MHYAAVALHPEMKLEYFSAEWADKLEWVGIARRETYALWNEEYKDMGATQLAASQAGRADGLERTPEGQHEEVQWRRNKKACLSSDASDPMEAFQQPQGEAWGITGGLHYWIKDRELGGYSPLRSDRHGPCNS